MGSLRLARQARHIAIAAAYGGGGLGLVSAGAFGLLIAEARLARRWIGTPTAEPPTADGWYAAELPGRPLRLVMIGDSTAAGFGVHLAAETPGGQLAAGLAEAAGQPVRLTNVAWSGAQSLDLDVQVTRALQARPDVAVVMVGANDVTHRVRPDVSVRLLGEAVRRLRRVGVEAVVGTCPDLGTVEPVAQPLRYIARRRSRALAAAQTIVVVEAGGRTVSLGDILGPEFAARPKELFGPDRFHPSAVGYAAAAMALLPSVCSAVRVSAVDTAEDGPSRTRNVAIAAAEAAEVAGTEVTPASVGGRERGPWGRWARLRRRPRGVRGDVSQRVSEAAQSYADTDTDTDADAAADAPADAAAAVSPAWAGGAAATSGPDRDGGPPAASCG